MQIKIVDCFDTSMWYNKHIGKRFKVFAKEYDCLRDRYILWVRTGDDWNTSNWINEKDIEYVEED